MRTWHKQHKGAIQLYGHSHGMLPEDPNLLSMDIGVDSQDFAPVDFESVRLYMEWKSNSIERLAEDRENKR